jgi:hypothetical protein
VERAVEESGSDGPDTMGPGPSCQECVSAPVWQARVVVRTSRGRARELVQGAAAA